MRRHLIAIWLLMLALVVGAGLAAANQAEEHSLTAPVKSEWQNTESVPSSTKDLTLMIYMCGSSLEESARAASNDLVEIMNSGFPMDTINIIVMAGGARGWKLPLISADTTRIYQLGNREIQFLYDEGEILNMGDPETLRLLLDYSYEHFSSENYALILWNHGGGAIDGICDDLLFHDSLSMEELDQAFRQSHFAERKLSWIGFDACMMASGEVAQVISPYADYMIASEELEPGYGWDYRFLGKIAEDETPIETGNRIADAYIEFCGREIAEKKSKAVYTISCVDLSRIDELVRSMDDYFASLTFNDENYEEISRIRRTVASFGRNEEKPDKDYDLIDLGDMLEKLESFGDEAEARSVMTALRECVVFSRSTSDQKNSTGLTMYFPYYNVPRFSRIRDTYDALSVSRYYFYAIHFFGDQLVKHSDQDVRPMNSIQIREANRDNRTIIQLKLEEDRVQDAEIVKILAVQRGETEGSWRFVAMQDAGINESGMAYGEYVHTNLFVTDQDGRPLYDLPIPYTERDDEMISIPVIMTDSNQIRTEARLICSRDRGAYDLNLVDLYLFDPALDGYSSRLVGDISDYVTISFPVEEKRPTYYGAQPNSALRPFQEWETLNVKELSVDLKEGWELRFVRDQLDTRSIAVLFQITDIYNHVYMSSPASITGERKTVQVTYDDQLQLRIDQESVKLTPRGILFMQVQNLSETETLMTIVNLEVNGVTREGETQIPGFGLHDGLDPEEIQSASIDLSLEEGERAEQIQFEILLQDVGTEQIESVTVKISIGAETW